MVFMMKMENIIQCQFLGLWGQVYFEDDNSDNHKDFLDEDIMNVQINFSDNNKYLLRAKGEYSLLVESIFDDLKDIDMNCHDYIKVIDLVDFFNLHHLLGLKIQAVQYIFYQSMFTGMVIIFEYQQIYIINMGDQIRLFTQSPVFLKQKEYRFVDEK